MPTTPEGFFEVIGSTEMAKRLNLPESWVRDQVRSRANDPIPHLRFGRYVRFQWGHPDLVKWLERRRDKRRNI
jgi:hypothetical protein